jgi:phosphoribosylpyrophosphate synthetase
MVILTGNAHPTLSQLVCERMGIRMGDAVVSLLNYTLAIIHILGLQ